MTTDRPPAPDLHGFAADARHAVALAEREARALAHERVGTEHLLLGLLTPEDGTAADALRAAGATLTAVRRKVTEAVGPGTGGGAAPRWTPRATRAIGRAPRFARDRRADMVAADHLLLALLDVEGTAGQVLRGLGIDLEHLRSGLAATDGDDADGVAGDDIAEATAPPKPPAMPPHCPTCRAPVTGGLQGSEVPLRGPAERRVVVVVSCPACGTTLGIV